MADEIGTTPSTPGTQSAPSIRDTVANAVESVEQATQPEQTETEQQKADRARDEAGRFAKEAVKQNNKQPVLAKTAVEKPKPQRPSSWKKDYWPHWDKLTAGQQLSPEEAIALAEYTAQREQDFAKGVSTYKGEWDKAKPVLEALNPIAPLVQQYGFSDTNQWLGAAVQTFRSLSGGSAQEKLGTLFQLAAHYQVPLEEIFEQAEDGRFYLNPQKFQQVRQPSIQNQQHQQNQARPQQDMREVVKELLMEEAATKQVQELASNQDQYPHLEQVRVTMAGLLRAGLVEDLKSAYDASLRMPQHKDLFDSIQAKQQEMDEQRQRDEAAKAAQSARAKTISPRSSTPAVQMKTEKGKGIRSTLEEAVNKVSGRV